MMLSAGNNVLVNLSLPERATDVKGKHRLVTDSLQGHKFRRLDWRDHSLCVGIDRVLRDLKSDNIERSARMWRYLARSRKYRRC
jgi:hypothetical protein